MTRFKRKFNGKIYRWDGSATSKKHIETMRNIVTADINLKPGSPWSQETSQQFQANKTLYGMPGYTQYISMQYLLQKEAH